MRKGAALNSADVTVLRSYQKKNALPQSIFMTGIWSPWSPVCISHVQILTFFILNFKTKQKARFKKLLKKTIVKLQYQVSDTRSDAAKSNSVTCSLTDLHAAMPSGTQTN